MLHDGVLAELSAGLPAFGLHAAHSTSTTWSPLVTGIECFFFLPVDILGQPVSVCFPSRSRPIPITQVPAPTEESS